MSETTTSGPSVFPTEQQILHKNTSRLDSHNQDFSLEFDFPIIKKNDLQVLAPLILERIPAE